MKSLGLGLLHLTLLMAVVSCGKNNQSGRSGTNWGLTILILQDSLRLETLIHLIATGE